MQHPPDPDFDSGDCQRDDPELRQQRIGLDSPETRCCSILLLEDQKRSIGNPSINLRILILLTQWIAHRLSLIGRILALGIDAKCLQVGHIEVVAVLVVPTVVVLHRRVRHVAVLIVVHVVLRPAHLVVGRHRERWPSN